MAQIRCEICGSVLVAISGGEFRCRECGVEYSADRVRELYQMASEAQWETREREDGTIEITGFEPSSTPVTEIRIPETISGKPVTALHQRLFCEYKELERVTLPDSIEGWGYATFALCNALTEINLPASMQEIAADSFNECLGFRELAIPGTIKHIRRGAFLNCWNMESITLPENLETLEMMTFSGCRQLQSISIPPHIKTIQDGTFSGCSELASVTLHEGLEKISIMSFIRCTKLTDLAIPRSVSVIGMMAFEKTVTLHVYEGSFAHQWAMDNEVKFVLR